MESGIVIALDVGTKLVGYAVYCRDAKRFLESGCLSRSKNQALQGLMRFIEQYAPSDIIAGVPLRSDGSIAPQSEDIVKFCRRLYRRTFISTSLIDESFSTQEAGGGKVLNTEAKRRKYKSSGALDAGAAMVIAKRYLDKELPYRIIPLDHLLPSEDITEE